MKHRGPGSSLRPAREAARAQARAATRVQARPASGSIDMARTAAAVAGVGDWVLEQDPDSGALLARHTPTDTTWVLATPPVAEGSDD